MGKFGELEAAVMEQLWRADQPSSVREVMEQLAPVRPLAYTTVMTVLERLYRKGMLTRAASGRAWAYQPAQSREDYIASVMAETLAGAPDKAATLVRFVDQVTPQEAKQLLKALTERRSRTRR